VAPWHLLDGEECISYGTSKAAISSADPVLAIPFLLG